MNTVIPSGVQAGEQAYRDRLRRAQGGTLRAAVPVAAPRLR
jgi:hypothetical protein